VNILVTGNKGYIGSVLTQMLLEKSYNVIGLDTDFYLGIEKDRSEDKIKQIFKDV